MIQAIVKFKTFENLIFAIDRMKNSDGQYVMTREMVSIECPVHGCGCIVTTIPDIPDDVLHISCPVAVMDPPFPASGDDDAP
jgi:hypothetical protein